MADHFKRTLPVHNLIYSCLNYIIILWRNNIIVYARPSSWKIEITVSHKGRMNIKKALLYCILSVCGEQLQFLRLDLRWTAALMSSDLNIWTSEHLNTLTSEGKKLFDIVKKKKFELLEAWNPVIIGRILTIIGETRSTWYFLAGGKVKRVFIHLLYLWLHTFLYHDLKKSNH